MRIARPRRVSLLGLLGIGIAWAVILWQPGPGHAQIYKYVKNGVVHYTDRQPDHETYKIVQDDVSSSLAIGSRKVGQTSRRQNAPYGSIIYKIAKAYELSPELIKAIIKVESNYNHRAISPKGAQGLMQLMPTTAKRFGVSDVFDPEENIIGGVKFLRHLFNEFGDSNLELVLAGYNAGEEAVRKYDNKIPPYTETQNYVKKVINLYLPASKYKRTRKKSIYRYVNENGVVTFTNVAKVN